MSLPPEPTLRLAQETALHWSGIDQPNRPGEIIAAQLETAREGFARLRGEMAFEEEPAGFLSALQALKEGGQ